MFCLVPSYYTPLQSSCTDQWLWTSGRSLSWTRWKVEAITRQRSSWRDSLTGKREGTSVPTITPRRLLFTETRWLLYCFAWNVIYYAIRYLVRQKANPGVRRRLLLGITSLLISAPQAARLPARDRNKCQRRGEWGRVKHIMASLTVQSQLEVIRFDIWVGKDMDMLEHANLNCRGVPNQQGPSIKQKSSRQPKKISLTGNKPRTQWGEMTCLPLKEENMLDLEAVATLALLLAPFPPRTLPPAPLVASPTLFQGSCIDPLRLSFNTMLLLQFGPECLWSGRQNGWSWLEVHKPSWAESCGTVRKCNRKGLFKK